MKVTLKVAPPREMFARTSFFFLLLQARENALSFVFLVNPCAKVRGEGASPSRVPSFACLSALINLQRRRKLRERGEDAGRRQPGRRMLNKYLQRRRRNSGYLGTSHRTSQSTGRSRTERYKSVFNLFRLPRTRALNFHHSLSFRLSYLPYIRHRQD